MGLWDTPSGRQSRALLSQFRRRARATRCRPGSRRAVRRSASPLALSRRRSLETLRSSMVRRASEPRPLLRAQDCPSWRCSGLGLGRPRRASHAPQLVPRALLRLRIAASNPLRDAHPPRPTRSISNSAALLPSCSRAFPRQNWHAGPAARGDPRHGTPLVAQINRARMPLDPYPTRAYPSA